jgi:hypothetical protein
MCILFCHAANAAGLSQVVLLKHLEKTTADLFETHKAFEDVRHTLGAEPENVRCDAMPQADASACDVLIPGALSTGPKALQVLALT